MSEAFFLGVVLGFCLGLIVAIGILTEAIWRGYIRVEGKKER